MIFVRKAAATAAFILALATTAGPALAQDSEPTASQQTPPLVEPMGCQNCEDPPNRMPSAVITAPTDGASILTGSVVTIAATGNDIDGVVVRMEFFVDGVKIGQDTTAPFTLPWTAAFGPHALSVIPYDDLGQQGFTSTVVDVVVNRPPTATLTAPATNQQFPTHAVVTLAANAADADGNLSRVDFYVDGVKVGQDTTAPFSYAWASTVGSHTAQAKAVDGYGSVVASASVAFTITNVAPTATVTAPTSGQAFPTGSVINLAANAADTDGNLTRVDFLVDGVVVGQDTTAPFTYAWASSVGNHTVQAKAFDTMNNVGTSAGIAFTITNVAPTVSLTAPTSGQAFPTGSVINLAANAADTDGNLTRVDFLVDGVVVGQDTTAPFTYAWASSVGNHTVQAKAFDTMNNVGTSAGIAFTITNVAPTVSLTAPTSGQMFPTGSVVNLTANAVDTDGNLARVEFFVDGIEVGQDTAAPFAYTWTSSTGNHTVQAKAFDTMNNVGTSASVAISVNNAPSVALTGLVVAKEYLAGGAVPMGATATDSDGTISKVEFLVGGVVVATDTTAPYATSWTGTVGTHQVVARAHDNLGRTTSSSAMSVLVVSRLTQVTRQYTYNAYQELCRVVEPETGATLMGYDAAGNLAWSASGLPAGTTCDTEGDTTSILERKVVRAYDQRNRIAALTFPDQRGDTIYGYTADGLLESIAAYNDGTQVTTTYQYNARRLMTQEVLNWGPVNWGFDYTYNANGHLNAHAWHGISVDYAPNALGQPTRAGTYASAVTYYPNGALKQFTYGNNVVHTMTQNERQLPARSLDLNGGVRVLDDNYIYDKNGNVKSITDGTTGTGNRTMTYDGLDRLKTVASPMYGSGASYTYDVLDNLTRAKIKTSDYYYCYDASWQLEFARTGSVCEGSNTSPAAIYLDYDPQGNVTSKNETPYEFDYGNRLRTAGTGGVTTTYAYDGHGRRVLDQTTEAKYSQYSAGGQLVLTSDLRADTVNEYIYLAGSLIATRERDVPTGAYTTKFYHTDALGSPVAVTNATGGVIEQKQYEPYGKSTPSDTPGYTGHVEDVATGLTYMQQRYYDPAIGRFLSIDPVAADASTGTNFNRYWYANNNPYRFTDPDGRIVRGADTNACGISGCESGSFEERVSISKEETAALAAGNLGAFWTSRMERGDPWGVTGVSIWDPGNQALTDSDRAKGEVTTVRLLTAMAKRDGQNTEGMQPGIVLRGLGLQYKNELQQIGMGVAFGHARLVTSGGGRTVGLESSAVMHHRVFARFDIPASAYGGTPFGSFAPGYQSLFVNELVGFCKGCPK